MGWTKRLFIETAYGELGLASYVYDLEPEQLTFALNKLDSMMAFWNTVKGIRIGYPLPSSPSLSTLETETDVPDTANEPIYLNLAVRLASSVGKIPSPDTKAAALAGYNGLLALVSKSPQMQMPNYIPAGAGNRQSNLGYDPFLNPPLDLETSEDNPANF